MPDAIRTTFTILHIRTLCPVYVESSRPPQCIRRGPSVVHSRSRHGVTRKSTPPHRSLAHGLYRLPACWCRRALPWQQLLLLLAFVTACASGGTFSSDGLLR